MTQQVEVPTTLTLAPPTTTQAARRKRSEKDLETEVAKRQRNTLGKNKSKGLLDNYSKSIVSVGGSTSTVGSNIFVKEALPRQKLESDMKGCFMKNPEGNGQVTEAKVASPTVQKAIPVESCSTSNPGSINQVAEARVAKPSVKGAFPPEGKIPKVKSEPARTTRKRPSFMERVKKVLRFPASPISPPPFKCELTAEAANSNFKLLSANEGNIGQVIEKAPFSPMSIGSEFKPPDILEPLLEDHPSWPQLRESLSHGATCPIREMDDDTMKRDFEIALKRGNSKSATEESEWIAEQFQEEVEKGWTLALPLEASQFFPKGVYAPLGVVHQDSINEKGEIVPKKRLVHNMSKEGAVSHCSANSRTKEEELETVKYGFCHRRLIHYIVSLRANNPDERIMMCKGDFKSAYRRKHSAWEAVTLSLTAIVHLGFQFLLASLRLTFGGTFCVSQWCLTSETITDLANALLRCGEWDHNKVFSRWQHMVPDPIRLPLDVPIAAARQMFVTVPLEIWGKIDCFIDDLPGVGLDTPANVIRLPAAILLAIELFTRQYVNFPIPRDEMVSITKLVAELGMSEQKIILGWMYDSRRLLISLPREKYLAWSHQIRDLLKRKRSNHNELKTLVGRLDHAAGVMPLARHFMERIRFATKSTSDRPNMPYTLNKTVLADLELMLAVLERARKGINMNLLTYRIPNAQSKVDACPRGLGGYSKAGRAWRFIIPHHLLGRAHINLLEFLAILVSVWLDIIEESVKPLDCLLVMGDSTTAVGWLHKTRIMKKDMQVDDFQAQTKVARKLATLIIENNMCLYSQWFPGKKNVIADSLSRDIDIPTNQLTARFKSLFPTQMPSNFNISPLPDAISSFILSTLSGLRRRRQSLEAHTSSELHPGASGKISSKTVDGEGVSFWMDAPSSNATPSWQPLLRAEGAQARRNRCPVDTSKVPLETYHRPFVSLGD